MNIYRSDFNQTAVAQNLWAQARGCWRDGEALRLIVKRYKQELLKYILCK